MPEASAAAALGHMLRALRCCHVHYMEHFVFNAMNCIISYMISIIIMFVISSSSSSSSSSSGSSN